MRKFSIRDDLPRRYVPRLVLKYPYHIVDGPYDHNGFLERAKEAQAEMHARLMPAGTDVSAAQAMLQDLSAVVTVRGDLPRNRPSSRAAHGDR